MYIMNTIRLTSLLNLWYFFTFNKFLLRFFHVWLRNVAFFLVNYCFPFPNIRHFQVFLFFFYLRVTSFCSVHNGQWCLIFALVSLFQGFPKTGKLMSRMRKWVNEEFHAAKSGYLSDVIEVIYTRYVNKINMCLFK